MFWNPISSVTHGISKNLWDMTPESMVTTTRLSGVKPLPEAIPLVVNWAPMS